MTNYDNREGMGLISATTSEGVKVAAQLACLVYDEQTGIVVHGHGAVVLEGGEMPSESAFQERALELARRTRELGGRSLQTLIVDLNDVPAGPMRIDVATKRIIADVEPERTPPGMPGMRAS
jgi:hypothetical protein